MAELLRGRTHRPIPRQSPRIPRHEPPKPWVTRPKLRPIAPYLGVCARLHRWSRPSPRRQHFRSGRTHRCPQQTVFQSKQIFRILVCIPLTNIETRVSLITAGLETELCGGDRRFLAVYPDARHGGCESTRPATSSDRPSYYDPARAMQPETDDGGPAAYQLPIDRHVINGELPPVDITKNTDRLI